MVKKGLQIRCNDDLDKKQTFFDYKENIFQRPKNRIFPKGLTHAFAQKNFFFLFFSLKIRLEVTVNNVLDIKKTFFDYKDKIFHSLKNRIFPKGLTHAFVKKVPLFLNLFSVKSRLEIVLTELVGKKETFFDYQN